MSFYQLVDEEAVLLDGRCRPEIQADVDAAKARLAMAAKVGDLSTKEAGLVADIVTEAKRTGRLTFVHSSIRYCSICERSAGYVKYKSGRRRGQSNYDRPLTLSAVDLGQGFVTIQHSVAVGCCWECWAKITPKVRGALADVRAQIPEPVMGHPPKWLKHEKVKCTECGWEGHEGEMRRKTTLFGDGTYPGGCPKCPAANAPLGRTIIERVGGFVVVPSHPISETPKP